MPAENRATPGPRYRWVILGVVYLAFLAYAIVFQTVPPLLSLIIPDLHLTHAEAGLLMSLFALPGVFLSLPVGILTDRYGPRLPMLVCLTTLIVGTLLFYAGRSFPMLALGRVIAGAGGLSLFVIGAQAVAQWFAGRELGIAVGLYSTGMPVGTIVSLNALGAAGVAIGWQRTVLIGVALAIVALFAFAVFYRPAPGSPAGPQGGRQTVSLAAIGQLGLPIWLVGAIWMLFNAGVISFLTFAPVYFVSRGFSVEYAGFLASFQMLLSPFLAPPVGVALDRLGREEWFIAVGGILVAVGALGVFATGTWLILALVVLSLGAVLVPTPVFALPPRVLPPPAVGTGYGVVSTCLNVGVVIGPALGGLARDATGNYQMTFYLVALYALLTTVVAVALRLARHGRRSRP